MYLSLPVCNREKQPSSRACPFLAMSLALTWALMVALVPTLLSLLGPK